MNPKEIDNDITDLARAFMLFKNCHHNLYSFLVLPENDEEVVKSILGSWKDISGKDKYNLELNQRIYAAATSMTALLAVSKILDKKYKNESFYLAYERNNKAIIDNRSFIFWRRLRNYITHSSEAPIGFKISTKSPMKGKVYLSASRLLDYDWRIGDKLDSPKDEKTIEYLIRYKNGIYLANIIFNYRKAMSEIWKDVFMSLIELRNNQSQLNKE